VAGQLVFTLILIAAVWLSYYFKKLTLAGALTGGVIAIILFLATGYTGIALLTTFFLLGTAATSHRKEAKLSHSGVLYQQKRTAEQVWANGGMAAILSLAILIAPGYTSLLTMMIAAVFASATADTLSSELGVVYGKRFYNIISFKPDQKGLDGVISLEGSLIGVAGSFILAVIYAFAYGWSASILWIIIGGTAGNLADSVLGAVLERKGLIGNNTVNFLNTMVGAIVSGLLCLATH